MIKPVMKVSAERFCEHMKEKADAWGPLKTYIGNDFAVFDFNFKYQSNTIVESLKHYAGYYGYKFGVNDKGNLVIWNTATK